MQCEVEIELAERLIDSLPLSLIAANAESFIEKLVIDCQIRRHT